MVVSVVYKYVSFRRIYKGGTNKRIESGDAHEKGKRSG